MQQNYCQQFGKTFENLRQKLPVLDDALNKFQITLDEAALDKIHDFENERGKFTKNYQEQAEALLEVWKKELDYPFDIDFEDSGRVVAKGTVGTQYMKRQTKTTYFPSLIRRVEGNVVFYNQNLPSLDYLEEVTGTLGINDNENLRSAKRLRFVDGDFDCSLAGIECLDSLERVGGSFHFNNTKLQVLPKLKKVGETFSFYDVRIRDFEKAFPSLEYLGGDVVVDYGVLSDYLIAMKQNPKGKVRIVGDIRPKID